MNLQDELNQAVQEVQAITNLDCPSSRFDDLCGDYLYMRGVLIRLRDDMAQYYAK